MHKVVVLLVCAASVVAAGVLDIQLHEDINNSRGTDRISERTHQQLLQQKFILDILQHVHEPLVNEELLALAHNLIVDQQLYIDGIDDEMLHVIELDREQRLLGKHEVFSIGNEQHLRQMIGIYRLLVRSRDWDTLQRNLCHIRMHVNGVLMVNSLMLAIRDRIDTQHIILPALHEILPELYHNEDLITRARNMDVNSIMGDNMGNLGISQRPGVLDMIAMNKRQRVLDRNVDIVGMGLLDRTKLWLPWRQMRLELQARKLAGEPTRVSVRSDDRIVLPVERRLMGDNRMELLTEDVGLKSFLHMLLNDLCLRETELLDDDMTTRRIGSTERLGRVGLERNVGSMLQRDRLDVDMSNERRMGSGERLGRMGLERNMGSMLRRDRLDDEMSNERRMGSGERLGRVGLERDDDSMLMRDRMNIERQRMMDNDNNRMLHRDTSGEREGMGVRLMNVDNDRLIHVGRRRRINNDLTMDREDISSERMLHRDSIMDGRRTKVDIMDSNESRIDLLMNQRRGQNDRMRNIPNNDDIEERLRIRMRGDDERDNDDNMRRHTTSMAHERMGVNQELPTTTIDDERLLHVGRRRLRQMKQMQQLNLDNTGNRFLNIIHGGDSIRDGRHVVDSDLRHHEKMRGMQRKQHLDSSEEEHSMWRNRDGSLERERQQQDRMIHRIPGTTNGNNNRWMRMERLNRQSDEEQDNIRGRIGERDSVTRVHADMDDMHRELPTTTIDDERLLHVGRRNRQQLQEQQQDNIRGGRWGKSDETDRMTRRWGDNQNSIHSGEQGRPMWQRLGRGMENMGVHNENMDMDTMRRRDDDSRGNQRWDNKKRTNMDDDRRKIDMDKDDDRMGMMHRRIPRSIGDTRRSQVIERRGGELLLHNLQQLLARINLERISLGMTVSTQDRMMLNQRLNNPRLIGAADERQALRLNEMRMDSRRDRLMLDDINEIETRLRSVIEQEVQRTIDMGGIHGLDTQNLADIDRVIGDILLGRNNHGISILNIIRGVIMQTQDLTGIQTLNHLGVDLQNPSLLHLLRRIVQIVDMQRQQQLRSYRREDLQLNGVTINNVVVDRLQTLVDTSDTDLINLLDSRVMLGRTHSQRMLVARQQRLDHKSFNINIEINSDRNQRVVIRTLLGPRIDANQLDEQRHNFLHLDATVVDLHTGRNMIKRKSRDIEWTTQDTTPLTELYQRVMLAIDGQLDVKMDRVQGQNCRFPHRLLLPRGRVGGLPMHLLVIATPVEDDMQQQLLDNTICGIGIGSLNLDRLPLGFPLDRRIDDMQQLLSLSNVHLANVNIYHEDK